MTTTPDYCVNRSPFVDEIICGLLGDGEICYAVPLKHGRLLHRLRDFWILYVDTHSCPVNEHFVPLHVFVEKLKEVL